MGWLKRKLPQKRWKRVLIYIASTFLILLALDMALVQYWRQVTISHETTRITSPLNKDGYPDYIAALDAKYSQGVTPQNNAARHLVALLGKDDMPAAWAQRVLPKLGLGEPPAKPRAQNFHDWAKDNSPADGVPDASEDGPNDSLETPWTRAAQPRWAAYLADQREAIELALAASSAEKFYVPLTSGSDTHSPGDMTKVLLPPLGRARLAANLLCADAMLAVGEGDAARALSDTLAVVRLGRLIASGPTLIEQLVGVAIEARGLLTMRAVIATGKMGAAQYEWLHSTLRAMPQGAHFVEALDHAERYMMLDSLCWVAKDGPAMMQHLSNTAEPPTLAARATNLLWPININAGLRYTNEAYDQLVAAARNEDYHSGQKVLKNLEDSYGRQAHNPANIITRPHAMLMAILLPSMARVHELNEKLLVERDLTLVAITLALHRDTQGAYPDKPDLPRDRFAFNQEPLKYRREANGFVLYSVGPDGTDDGGTPRPSNRDGNKPYDVVVRVER